MDSAGYQESTGQLEEPMETEPGLDNEEKMEEESPLANQERKGEDEYDGSDSENIPRPWLNDNTISNTENECGNNDQEKESSTNDKVEEEINNTNNEEITEDKKEEELLTDKERESEGRDFTNNEETVDEGKEESEREKEVEKKQEKEEEKEAGKEIEKEEKKKEEKENEVKNEKEETENIEKKEEEEQEKSDNDTESWTSSDDEYKSCEDHDNKESSTRKKSKNEDKRDGSGKDKVGSENKKSKDGTAKSAKDNSYTDKLRNRTQPEQASGWSWSSWSPWSSSSRSRKIVLPKLNRYSSDDTKEYRMGYPGKRDNPNVTQNYKFYTNQIPSYPQGDYIDRIHQHWKGNYDLLEFHHSYIQWLFPIRERGLNWHAEELQLHEIEAICADEEAKERIIKSYELMLDFYGLRLKDRQTGEVERSENFEECFRNLNRSSHNYLRITRILKCLGEFKLEHYKPPLIRYFLHEAITTRKLENILSSCMNYWVGVVKDDQERAGLRKLAQQLVDEANSKLK